jgi:hypothetical protein
MLPFPVLSQVSYNEFRGPCPTAKLVSECEECKMNATDSQLALIHLLQVFIAGGHLLLETS